MAEPGRGAQADGGAPIRLFDGAVGGLNALGSAWILVLMLLINADAFGRTLFDRPITGVLEIVTISIVAIVFLQLADSLRRGIMTRSDGLHITVTARHRGVGQVMGVVTHLLGAGFMGLVLYGSFPLMTEAWTQNHYIGVEGVFTAPMWPVKLVIVVGCTVTLIQFLVIAFQTLRPASPASDRPG